MTTTDTSPFERPVAHWLARGPLAARAVLTLGRDLALALTALHLHDRTAGEFGAADVWSRDDLSGARLRRKPVAQAGDALEAAVRRDLAALGRLLFLLLTGRTFQPDADGAYLRQGFAIVKLYAPRVSAEVDGLVARLIDPGPRGRYERAKQVFDDLRVLCGSSGEEVAFETRPAAPPAARPAAAGAAAPPATTLSSQGALRSLAGVLASLLILLKVALPVTPPRAAPAIHDKLPMQPVDHGRLPSARNAAARAVQP